MQEAPEADEMADDDSAWLCCDKCSAWVLAIADGIVNVAPYADNTPNPLPYLCPACRKAQGAPAATSGLPAPPSASAPAAPAPPPIPPAAAIPPPTFVPPLPSPPVPAAVAALPAPPPPAALIASPAPIPAPSSVPLPPPTKLQLPAILRQASTQSGARVSSALPPPTVHAAAPQAASRERDAPGSLNRSTADESVSKASNRFGVKGLSRGLSTLIRASLAARGGKASVAQLVADIAPYYAGLESATGTQLYLPLHSGINKALAYLDQKHLQRGYVSAAITPPSQAEVAKVQRKALARIRSGFAPRNTEGEEHLDGPTRLKAMLLRLLRGSPMGMTADALREACGADLADLRSSKGKLYKDMSAVYFATSVTRLLQPMGWRDHHGLWRLHDTTRSDVGVEAEKAEEESDAEEEDVAEGALTKKPVVISDSQRLSAIAREHLDRIGKGTLVQIGEGIRSKLGDLRSFDKIRYGDMPPDQLARNVGRALQGYALRRPNSVCLAPKLKRGAVDAEPTEPPAKAQKVPPLYSVFVDLSDDLDVPPPVPPLSPRTLATVAPLPAAAAATRYVSPPAHFESLSERSEAPDAMKRAAPVDQTPDAKRARSDDAQAEALRLNVALEDEVQRTSTLKHYRKVVVPERTLESLYQAIAHRFDLLTSDIAYLCIEMDEQRALIKVEEEWQVQELAQNAKIAIARK